MTDQPDPAVAQLVDRWGTKWIMVFGTVLSIPMYPLFIIKGPLPLFIFFQAVLGEWPDVP